MWIQTGDSLVEISVFETGVPPRFRLYFFDREKNPRPVPPPPSFALTTLRPNGGVETYSFGHQEDFLESTSDIPEPHEFEVTLVVSHNGHAHTYKAQFTEDDHGHRHEGGEHGHPHPHGQEEHPHGRSAHSHDHDHDHGLGGHSHDHGFGLLGWVRGTFAHSHSIEDKIDETMETHERGIWALKVSLVGLTVTALLQVIIVLLSGSVALLADTIHNFGDATTSIPLWVAFVLTNRGVSRKFTYGYGKTEDVAGVIIVLVIFFSACVAAYESVMKIIHPQPIGYLGWVAAAAIVGFIGNEAVAVLRLKVGREIQSAALIADGQHARVDGFTSLAVLLGVIGVWAGYPIVDPLIGIAITIAILFIVKDASKAVWNRMIDGIELETVETIEHAPLHVPGVRGVHHVRARWIGHKVHTDLRVDVSPEITVLESHKIAEAVEESLKAHIRSFGGAVVRICPAGPEAARSQ
jgi:cation diffusion facilitator family transporter